MKLPARKKTPREQLKNAAIEAVLSALGDEQRKPALTGPRAVATGAVLYTVGRAALKGRSSAKTATTPSAKRKPVRTAPRKKSPEQSLALPQQRWPRMSAARR